MFAAALWSGMDDLQCKTSLDEIGNMLVVGDELCGVLREATLA